MRSVCTLLAAVAVGAGAQAQPDPEWVIQFGTPTTDIAEAMAADGAGGAFLAMTTWGALGEGLLGGSDLALARFDAAGSRLWLTQFGSAVSDTARGLAPDGAGGVYLTGFTGGEVGGARLGGVDAFVLRFDGAGERVWGVQYGTGLDDHAHAAEADGAGGVFIAGTTFGELAGPNEGQRDCTLARFDGTGARLWVVQFGTGVHDVAVALAADGNGGVFVGGRTGGSLGGPKQGKYDGFIARYDGEGNRLWITQEGTQDSDGVFALAADGAGGVWAAGETYGDLFAPQAGVADVFITRHDDAGVRTFAEQFGTAALDFPTAIASDGAGGVFVAGDTDGDLLATSAGLTDAFVIRIGPDGGHAWGAQFGTPAIDGIARSLARAGAGVVIPGETLGDLAGPNAGGWDIFIARYGCAADLDGDGLLSLFDYLAFTNLFNEGDVGADCDGSGGLELFDFLCYANLFNQGC